MSAYLCCDVRAYAFHISMCCLLVVGVIAHVPLVIMCRALHYCVGDTFQEYVSAVGCLSLNMCLLHFHFLSFEFAPAL